MADSDVIARLREHHRKVVQLERQGSWGECVHLFETETLVAVEAAWAASRPLLIRGEPGIGKSQLARAVAQVLGRPFLPFVVNATCESTDLLYAYDAVSRLAQAQRQPRSASRAKDSFSDMAEARFIRPRVLWWAYDWDSAKAQAAAFCVPEEEPFKPARWEPGQGTVVLIDEIDKADSDLPNGLLECLGNHGFDVPQARTQVALKRGAEAPLVIITTNEERELPAAFLRRCFVLPLPFPKERDDQVRFLMARGKAHFSEVIDSDEVYDEAAQQVVNDREKVPKGQPKPGAAEYLDLLRALGRLCPGDTVAQLGKLHSIKGFALNKHLDDSNE
jgi:MoxR-like ATPase